MAGQLSYKPLDNIGIDGLNTQANPSTLAPSWLVKADNIVLRESGRISFRKGLKQKILKTTDKIGSLAEHRVGSFLKVFAGVGTNIYEVDFSTPDTPWTNVFATGGTASDWQFINFNNEMVGFQADHDCIHYQSNTWGLIKNDSGYTSPNGVTNFNPSCGMGYYGRVWAGGIAEEKDVVYYSDTLNAHKWNSAAAGYLDLKTVWGKDDIVAIAPFYGKLVIFGKHNIAIYNNPSDPTNMALDEVVRGIGCSSRDSVIAVGDDLLFLSDTGLRSLNRTTQLDKIPLQEFSINIKDTLIRHIAQSSNVKSVYIQNEGIYLLSFVDLGINYVFDTKHNTPNGVPRITTWSFDADRHPTSVAYTESKGLLVGQGDGSIATYEGYFDKVYVSGGTHTQNSYTGTFSTIWINLGDSVGASLLKKLKAVISGGSGTFVGVKWYKDFSQTPSKTSTLLLNPTTTGTTSLWGSTVALFGAAKYTPLFGLKEYNIPLTGSAKHLQIEMSAETNGYVASLQDMTLLFKQGKIR